MFDERIGLQHYAARIGHRTALRPTLECLCELLQRHTEAIAFENLDSLAGEVVSLRPSALEEKLLVGGRGGYCFEHNMLLWNVLEQCGFEVSGLAARVRWNVPADVTTPVGHMLLKVTVAGVPYLVDAGFGGLTLTAPLRLDTQEIQQTPHEPFVVQAGSVARTIAALMDGEWRPLYQFVDLEYHVPDYTALNWFTCTSPDSVFTRTLMCARPDVGGRHALLGNRYTWRGLDGTIRRETLASGGQLRRMLTEAFHIRVPDSAALSERLHAIATGADDGAAPNLKRAPPP